MEYQIQGFRAFFPFRTRSYRYGQGVNWLRETAGIEKVVILEIQAADH